MTYNRGSYGSKGLLVQALFSLLNALKELSRLAVFSFDNTNIETQNAVCKTEKKGFGSVKLTFKMLKPATVEGFVF